MIHLNDQIGDLEDLIKETQSDFSDTGMLSESEKFEYRPQQQQLAVNVAENLVNRSHLLAEAGTGVGKSLAYLIPSIKYALAADRKCIISTHTINLQEQLLHKDVPLAVKLIGKPVQFTLLKGRQNYLCPTRLKRALQSKGDLFNASEVEELKLIWKWSEKTADGTLSDLDFKPSYKVWSQVCSESDICTQRRCGPTGQCHYQEARKRANDSQLIILNHTLFFSVIDPYQAEKETGFLFPNDFVVFDEAHTLENVAAKQLGLRVSALGVRMELQKLYNPRTRKGVLRSCQRTDIAEKVDVVADKASEFFTDIDEVLFEMGNGEVRVKEPEIVPNTLSLSLQDLLMELNEAAEEVDHEITKAELNDSIRKLGDINDSVKTFLNQGDGESVYWAEKTGTEDRNNLTLSSAPIDLAERLKRFLFASNKCTIMTSATLSVKGNNDLSYFKRRVGADFANELIVGSPFDYGKQMKVFIGSEVPDPRHDDYQKCLIDWVVTYLDKAGGRAFVLFTSYRLMQAVGTEVERLCAKEGWDFFQQGESLSRQGMIDGFRASENAVLLGTDSFWTGVDVPGEGLSNVIITRLPFEVPTHPVIEARHEAIEAKGMNSFMHYSLPEAVLKFRQGIGRLIRSEHDRGNIVILDNRVLTKNYGKDFLSCVAPAVVKSIPSPHKLGKRPR